MFRWMTRNDQHLFSLENILQTRGRAILLIRNPFKAILSWYKHLIHGIHSNTAFETSGWLNIAWNWLFIKNSYFWEEKEVRLPLHNFERFTLENVNIWRTTIEDWITLGEVHVVHYENVLENRMTEIEKILNFLQITIQKWRLSCVKFCNLDMYLRKNGTHTQFEVSPYSRLLKNVIWKNILDVNEMLVSYGHDGLPLDKYIIP